MTRMWGFHRSLGEEVFPELEKIGLFPMAPWLLAMVAEHHYPKAILERVHLPAPTLSQMLRRLEAAGLVKRLMDQADLRRYRFELTEKGKEAQEAGRRCYQQALEKRLARLSKTERQEFARLLKILASPAAGSGQDQ